MRRFDGLPILARFFKAGDRRRRYRRTVAELSALDDHVLDDIGVRRDDIPALAARLARMQAPARHR